VDKAAITTIVLTKDEQANLSRCLASVPWSGAVVIDSGSTDATVEVAGNCGAIVFIHKQNGPFDIAKQRNWAIASCNIDSEWILFLDADEELTVESVRAVERACSCGDEYDAFELTPKFLFWGRWLKRTQGYPNWHGRLVKNIDAPFEGGVWEHFRSNLRVGRILEPYNHYGFSKGVSAWIERHNRYSTWDGARIHAFLQSGDSGDLGTTRKLRLRRLAARLWPIRPIVHFVYMYICRIGFTEGLPGFVYCVLCMFYEFMTVCKIYEQRRVSRGLPL
jgi:glycosyltransferase involved in cell wall biosynthesis